jgi:ubiquitin-conjugating enzyme E2 J1
VTSGSQCRRDDSSAAATSSIHLISSSLLISATSTFALVSLLCPAPGLTLPHSLSALLLQLLTPLLVFSSRLISHPLAMASAASRPGVGHVNASNPAVKRIMREYAEFSASYASAVSSGSDIDVVAAPLEDNLFEWHFTLRGPPSTAFASGLYHGRILLPSNYPFRPPDVVLLTPSGRFEIGKKICLSISSFHPANWQPSWSIRTVLTALTAFFPTPAAGAIGSLDYTETEKAALAVKSRHFTCTHCKLTNEQIMESARQRQLQQQQQTAAASTSTSSHSSTASATPATPVAPISPSPPPSDRTPAVTLPKPDAPSATVEPPSAPPAASSVTSPATSTSAAAPAVSSLSSSSSPAPPASSSSSSSESAAGIAQPAAAVASSSSASAAVVDIATAPSKLSRVTVLLSLLIFALLMRKLFGHLLRLHSSSSGLQHSTSSLY